VPTPLVLAHRGACQEAPENTLAAFAVALDQGADGVELDVHLSADARLVVHHDASARGLGGLALASLADIRTARPDIPTLEEVLDLCAGRLVNVEVKHRHRETDPDVDRGVAGVVVDCLARRGGADRIIVSSFDLPTVDAVRALDATVPTAYLVGPFARRGPRDAPFLEELERCYAHGHRALHPAARMLAGARAGALVTRARELGLMVNVWTVNDPQEIRRLAAAGVDAIITDVPATARAALARDE
jgi:glycerophosphoryl diester phosphodiesterase